MHKKSQTLSVVIPCYNSPSTLSSLVLEIVEMAPLLNLIEVILVFDGPNQDNKPKMVDIKNSSVKIKFTTLSKNFGQHNAIYAGILIASGELIITLDDDSQHLPSEFIKLLGALDSEIDVVYGVALQEEHGLFRSFASRFVKRLLKFAGVEHATKISAFRLFRRDLITELGPINNPFVQLDVLLGWTTSRMRSVGVVMSRRSEGKSNYSFSKLMTYAYNLLTGYSVKPLRIVSYTGLLSFLMGILLSIYSVASYFIVSKTPSGFTFIAATLSLFSGIQLLSLGMISEYLGRIFAHTSGQPTFRTISDQKE